MKTSTPSASLRAKMSVVYVCSIWLTFELRCEKKKHSTQNSSAGVSLPRELLAASQAPPTGLPLGSVDVVDGRQEFLAGLLVYVRAQTNVHQVGELLHGVLLHQII